MIKDNSHMSSVLDKHLKFIKTTNKKKKHNYKHISVRNGYEFMDLVDWKWDDNHGNSNGRKTRVKYRWKMARIAKMKDKREAIIEIEKGIYDWDFRDDESDELKAESLINDYN